MKVEEAPKEEEKKNDDAIADVDPNAMFAFSQIAAVGGNVIKTCDDLDKD